LAYRDLRYAPWDPRDHLYDYTMYILCRMLVIGPICNALVKPVAEKWYINADEVAKLQAASAAGAAPSGSFGIGKGGFDLPANHLLAVRRHPARLGRLADAEIGGGAVLTAASHSKRTAQL
jgi:hypothetical protein